MFTEDVFLLARECGACPDASRFEQLLFTAVSLGLDEADLREDIERVLVQRLIFVCVGGVEPGLSYRDRRRRISARLKRLLADTSGVSLSDRLVNRLTQIAARIAYAGNGPRESVATIDSSTLNELLREQGYRCAVCGIPVSESVRKADAHFPGAVESVAERTLEHVQPFMLFGNKTTYEILCTNCNACKKERMGWHEDGPVITGNVPLFTVKRQIARRVRFWTLYRRRRCDEKPCAATSATSVMYADEKSVSPSSFGLLKVRCSDHANHDSRWIHAASGESDVARREVSDDEDWQ